MIYDSHLYAPTRLPLTFGDSGTCRYLFAAHPIASLPSVQLDAVGEPATGARRRFARRAVADTAPVSFWSYSAIILLALAVAAPIIRTSRGAIPLIVVLDDSFSMLAGVNDTPRSRAIAALEKELDTEGLNPLVNRRYAVRYVLAGAEPQILSDAAKTAHEATAQLEDWRCLSPFADFRGGDSVRRGTWGTEDSPPCHDG